MYARSQAAAMTEVGQLTPMLTSLARSVAHPRAGVVFVSGNLARDVGAAASAVRAAWPNVPSVVVPAAGVLTQRGEIERVGAASAMVWTGGRAEAVVPRGPAIGQSLADAARHRRATAFLFCRPDWLDPDALSVALARTGDVCVIGAGTVGPPPIGISSGGTLLEAPAVALVLTDLATPLVEASPASELLGGFARVDEAEGGCLLRVGGRPALDALSACASRVRKRTSQPFVFAAVALDGDQDAAGRNAYIVRPIRGIDPSRRGVYIGAEARVGARVAFALRDPEASHSNFQHATQQLHARARGADPRFALFVDCAGRGESLYGAPDVDTRVLRQRFGELPIAGLQSAFEIAPKPESWRTEGAPPNTRSGGGALLHFYTGVVALFRSPS